VGDVATADVCLAVPPATDPGTDPHPGTEPGAVPGTDPDTSPDPSMGTATGATGIAEDMNAPMIPDTTRPGCTCRTTTPDPVILVALLALLLRRKKRSELASHPRTRRRKPSRMPKRAHFARSRR
jgi:hypothetical protein